MRRLLLVALLATLAGCAETAGQKWRDAAALKLHAAQALWDECAADSKCAGDEMFKRRAQFTDAQAEYDRANHQVESEYAAVASSMREANRSIDQMQWQLNQPYVPAIPAQAPYLAAPTQRLF